MLAHLFSFRFRDSLLNARILVRYAVSLENRITSAGAVNVSMFLVP